MALSSLDEGGKCPAGTDSKVDGQCTSSTKRSATVDANKDMNSGADTNVRDTDEFVRYDHLGDDMNDSHGDDDDDDDDYDDDYDGSYEDDGDGNDYHGDDNCKDRHDDCEMWASMKECENNPNYMLRNCKKSCNACEEESDPATKYGDAQKCTGDETTACLSEVAKMEAYMISESESNPAFREILPKCKNRHTGCALWASMGECAANPKYMEIHCAPVCGSCMLLDFNYRCPLDPDAKDALAPGDLNRMFERIVDGKEERGDGDEDGVINWNATVHSRPSHPPNVNPDEVDYILGPWVITIDSFVSHDECMRLQHLGSVAGYERSTDVGGQNFDGTFKAVESTSRTSYNAWCSGECFEDPMTQSVLDKISNLTGISDKNSEHLQLLRYEEGQFYKQHHDYIEVDRDRPTGVRILTAYLYLNDVEAGGGTRFPKLKTADNSGLTVMPKMGRLLLWPSVRDDEPSRKDFRTDHEALKVEKGEKYGANGWVHMRDFKTPYDNNCS